MSIKTAAPTLLTLALSACVLPDTDPVPLDAFGANAVGLETSGDLFQVKLLRDNLNEDCAPLDGQVRATVNGTPLELADPGQPSPVWNGVICHPAVFTGPRSLLPVTGRASIAVSDDSHQISLEVVNPGSERVLVWVSPAASLHPRDELRLRWTPDSDRLATAEATVVFFEPQPSGGVPATAGVELQGTDLVAVVPPSISPGTYLVFVQHSGSGQIPRCEGVARCDHSVVATFSGSMVIDAPTR